MSILGKPTDQDLDQYSHVLLTSPHEWDPSVLDYAHPNTCGYPSLTLQLGTNMLESSILSYKFNNLEGEVAQDWLIP